MRLFSINFIVFMAIIVNIVVVCVTLCSLERDTEVSEENWYPPTKLHGATTQKSKI
jgi:hypothetical protein